MKTFCRLVFFGEKIKIMCEQTESKCQLRKPDNNKIKTKDNTEQFDSNPLLKLRK